MAKKTSPPARQPSSSSSSSSSSEESSSSSEEERTIKTKSNSQKAPTKNQESESESETEEESSEEDENQKPKPIISTPSKPKPIISTPSKPKPKPKPEPEPVKLVTPSKPITEKSSAKSPFARVWSLDDEVAILEGLVDYQSKKNGPVKLHAAFLKEFHDSVRKSLSADVDTSKLALKMRKLKNKYTAANKKGGNLKFAKDHDRTIHELSKKAWGNEVEEEVRLEAKAPNGGSSAATVNKGKSLKRDFPYISDALGGNRVALEMLETVDAEKAMVLEKKLKKLKFSEVHLMRKVYDVLFEDSEQLID